MKSVLDWKKCLKAKMAEIRSKSKIVEFYRNKSIFITGGTGFIGKVLVEKLLRSCTYIKAIYLLVRPKKGKCPSERIQEMFEKKIFEKLKSNDVDFATKIVLVSGDLASPDLGISHYDRQLIIRNVSIIFHIGATVKFTEGVKSTLQKNVYGTKCIIDLAKKIKNLQALIYISTAYCNTHLKEVSEKIYPTDFIPQKLLDCLQWMDEEMLESLKKKFLVRHPNIYCFSKSLAEQLLDEESNHHLPIIIIRPAFIFSVYREPLPGWMDLYSGPGALYVGFATGLLRIIRGSLKNNYDGIPVDFCVNMIIASAWSIAEHKNTSLPIPTVYHCTNGSLNRINCKMLYEELYSYVYKFPLNKCYRYPRIIITENQFIFEIGKILFHYIPAILVDGAFLLLRKKPKFTSLYRKVHQSINHVQFFFDNIWNFEVVNYKKLLDSLSAEDRKLFNFDVRGINWKECGLQALFGTRWYLLNEEPETIPSARRRMRLLHYLDWVINVILIGGFFYILPLEIWTPISDFVYYCLNWLL